MSDRGIPFDEQAVCDFCGINGAYDFVGDLICQKCYEKIVESQKQVDEGKFKSFEQVQAECEQKFGKSGS